MGLGEPGAGQALGCRNETPPTLAGKSGKETLLEQLIDSEILGPASSCQTASMIWNIQPYRMEGQGVLDTKPILFFGKTAVLLADETTRRHNIQQLDLIGTMVGG